MYTDNYGLVTVNKYGNTEADSFVQTVELFVTQRKQKENTIAVEYSIDNALRKMHLGNGKYKNHPEYPHPEMDRHKRRFMNKKILSSIIKYYKITGNTDRLKEIQRATKYGISYNNIGTKEFKSMSVKDIIYLLYFYLMTLIRLK